MSPKLMWWTTPAPGIECAKRGSLNNESPEGVVHMQLSTIGVDLAKNVFQVHGVDNAEGHHHPSVAAQAGHRFLEQDSCLPGRYGSLRNRSLLGS
jgi:hypothetical protein